MCSPLHTNTTHFLHVAWAEFDEEQANYIATNCGLTTSETKALREEVYDLDYFITMLVNEHNKVGELFIQSTAMGKLEEMRGKLKQHAADNKITRYKSFDEIPRPLLATLKSTSSWDDGYLKQMLGIPLLPDRLWNLVLQVFNKHKNYDLLGQKRPKTLPAKLPVPAFAPFIRLITRPKEFIENILKSVLQNQISIKEIATQTNDHMEMENLEAHVSRYLSWDFENNTWKWEQERTMAELETKFPKSGIGVQRVRLLTHLLDSVKKLSLDVRKEMLKAPQTLKADRPPHKTLQRLWATIPDIVKLFVRDQAKSFHHSTAAAVADASDEILSIQNPRGATDVEAKFLTTDVRKPNNWLGVEYTAAHLQLPSSLSVFDVGLIVSNVVSGGSEERLVVMVWCTIDQEQCVFKSMTDNLSCKHVERNYWWISQPPSAPNPRHHTAKDVQIALVGYFSLLSNPNFVATPQSDTGRRHRSSVVYAPQIPPSKRSKVPNGRPCDEEMNLAVPLNFIEQHTSEGDWVADFLCGSGSAAVAAILSGRNCLVVDIKKDMVTSCLHSHAH